MHMTRGWTGFRATVLALGLLAWNAPRAAADDILTYSTSGAVATGGVSGAGNVISFVPVQTQMVDTASNLSLGYFQEAPLPAGETTTYNNTPFTLTFGPSAFDGNSISDPPITITGHFNGTVSGPFQSSVRVSFDSITSSSFAVPGGTSSLNLLKNDQELLVPSSVNSGRTTLQASIETSVINPKPAPEPSTIALFLSMVGGLGLRRLVQKRRQRSAA
jgi:hypothetical protein